MPKFNIRFMLTVQGVEGEDEDDAMAYLENRFNLGYGYDISCTDGTTVPGWERHCDIEITDLESHEETGPTKFSIEEEGIVVMMPEGRHEGFDCAVCEEADKRARAAAGKQ